MTRPADGESLRKAVHPHRAPGTVNLDAEPVEAREDAVVRRLAQSGPFALVNLAGVHALRNNVPETVAYIRVWTNTDRGASIQE